MRPFVRIRTVSGWSQGSWTLGRLAGIPIRLHWTIAFLPMLLISELGWLAIPATALFLLFVTLHEMGHAVVAQDVGLEVPEILLTPLGGVAMIRRFEVPPAQEMRIAIAGPLVSLGLAAAGAVLAALLHALGFSDGALLTVALVAMPNLGLCLFNLLPAFPMDGGRLLRAQLSIRRSRLEATRIASRTGRVLAVIGGVAALVLAGDVRLAFLALVVWALAGWEYQVERQRAEQLGGFLDVDGDGEPDDVIVGPPPYAQPDHAHLGREMLRALRILCDRGWHGMVRI